MQAFISKAPIVDEEWDNFLKNQPTGHHVQGSAWGVLKATGGMDIIRVIVRENEEIIGGAQILSRPLPVFGEIGYISRGPVIKEGRIDVLDFLFDAIEKTAKQNRLIVLSIGLPVSDQPHMNQLSKRNFMPSDFYIIPPTTVLVSLDGEEEEILMRMKSRTRRNVRKGLKSDLVVREGRDEDIPLIFSWMEEAAKQDPYYYYNLEYYHKAMEILGEANILKLFVADFEGTPVSGAYVAALGDWAVFKWGASSGEHLDKRPNELIHWHAIKWSKSFGCKYYDLGGITPLVAEALNNGNDLPDIKGSGIAHFKLGFGEKHNFPDAYDTSYSMLPNWFVRGVVKYVWDNQFLRNLARKVLNPGP